MSNISDHRQLPPHRPDSYVGPEIKRFDAVERSRVRWLWDQRIARGKLTLLAGDPGLGKSFITCDLASRVSTGKAFPGEVYDNGNPMDRQPAVAVLLSAEDDPSDTIRPRLEAAGADLHRVAVITGFRSGSSVTAFNLKAHFRSLRALCKSEPEIQLIVIDPISAYMGDEEGHSNTKVRNLLAPLAQLAQDFQIAVVAVTHLNKGGGQQGGSAIYRTMGSLAFTAAARTVHLVTKDPDDDTGTRRLLLPIKNNLGQDRFGMAYQLDLDFSTGGTRVRWDDQPTDEPADTILHRLSTSGVSRGRSSAPATDAAAEFLQAQLMQGPQPVQSIKQAATAQGIAEKTLRNAREALGVVTEKTSGSDAHWTWALPGDSHAQADLSSEVQAAESQGTLPLSG